MKRGGGGDDKFLLPYVIQRWAGIQEDSKEGAEEAEAIADVSGVKSHCHHQVTLGK